jgi:hypothetical protein
MGWTTVVRFPAGAGIFSFQHRIHTGSGAHPYSYPVGTGSLSPGVKWQGLEADHSSCLFDAEVGAVTLLFQTSSWRGD